MGEKTFKLMSSAGAFTIVLGIISIVVGISIGVLSIINGARLIKGKTYISF
jgi:uncharacterized membrane protein YgaE (UPF0421/DUF939 family)